MLETLLQIAVGLFVWTIFGLVPAIVFGWLAFDSDNPDDWADSMEFLPKEDEDPWQDNFTAPATRPSRSALPR